MKADKESSPINDVSLSEEKLSFSSTLVSTDASPQYYSTALSAIVERAFFAPPTPPPSDFLTPLNAELDRSNNNVQLIANLKPLLASLSLIMTSTPSSQEAFISMLRVLQLALNQFTTNDARSSTSSFTRYLPTLVDFEEEQQPSPLSLTPPPPPPPLPCSVFELPTSPPAKLSQQ